MKPYFETKLGKLYHGDCLEIMKNIPDGSIDMILTDPPYGTTKNKWDSVIDLKLLWIQLNRIAKLNAAVVMFGQDKFTARVMLSNEKNHRYNLIWDKYLVSGFLNANRMPLRSHEDIIVFYKKLPTYNPQKTKGIKNHSKGLMRSDKNNNYGYYGKMDNSEKLKDMKHPKSILHFTKTHPSKCIHPTQKPVALMEYLIRSYTNEGERVLDFTMGSGTTGVACEKSNRRFIGIELDEDKRYCEIAAKRIEAEAAQLKLFA